MERINGVTPVSIVRPFVDDDYDRYIADNMKTVENANNPRVGVIGIPFDASTMMRRGSKYGPEAIRKALSTAVTFNASYDIDLDKIEWVDLGNVDVPQTIVEPAWNKIEEVMEPYFQNQFFYVILGGDHGITYPVIKALAKTRGGHGGIVMMDTHYDVRFAHHGEQTSGVPFRRLIEEVPEISGVNIVEIGINGWHNGRIYRDYCNDHGISVIPASEVHRKGSEYVAEKALKALKDVDWIYLSIDIDASDPAYAPGTNSNHNIGGLTSWEFQDIVYLLSKSEKLVGMDVTEVSPMYDSTGITAELGATLILNSVAGHMGKPIE